MASKSSDTIRPVWPKDFSSILREGEAHHSTDHAPDGFTPGTLVLRDENHRLIGCDIGDTVLNVDDPNGQPVEVVWTDGVFRSDAVVNHVNGGPGVTVKRYTTFCGPAIFDIKKTAIVGTFADPSEATPTPFVIMSDTFGKLEVTDAAVAGETVGSATTSPLGSDWVRIKLNSNTQ